MNMCKQSSGITHRSQPFIKKKADDAFKKTKSLKNVFFTGIILHKKNNTRLARSSEC